MISFKQYVKGKDLYSETPLTPEIAPKKNQWVGIPSNKLIKFSDDMISLVQKAYEKTSEGSFINTTDDVERSNWQAIDVDKDPESDATIFYRTAYPGENFKTKKIQGIGHDGSRVAINAALNKLVALLNSSGWWIEASGALEHILYKNNVKYITDIDDLTSIFPDAKFIDDRGKYNRTANNKTITETIFGNPL